MTSTLPLVLGGLALIGTILATVRVRRPVALNFPVMMTSWLVGELAVFHLVAQLVAAGVFVASGAFDSVAGGVGVALLLLSIAGLAAVQRLAGRARPTFDEALERGFGVEAEAARDRTAIAAPPPRRAWLPFWFDQHGVEIIRNIAYGEHPVRNRLDIYCPTGTTPGDALPVVLFAHGGAWVIGSKEQQGKPMLLHLARNGYVAVTINYRLGPRHRWPAQIIDVKRAIAWTREHIADYGGDPSFIALSGASAGGHLAALAALTPNEPMFQPGFETADTTVAACIPIYPPTDLTNDAGLRGRSPLRRFLEQVFMPATLAAAPELWREASPLFHVRPDAPPMFVIQGALDVLVWREETQRFVDRLRSVSASPVISAEVRGAQHAFDVFNSVRCLAEVDAITRFLTLVVAARAGAQQHRDD